MAAFQRAFALSRGDAASAEASRADAEAAVDLFREAHGRYVALALRSLRQFSVLRSDQSLITSRPRPTPRTRPRLSLSRHRGRRSLMHPWETFLDVLRARARPSEA